MTRRTGTAALLLACTALSACIAQSPSTVPTDSGLESIYVLRTIQAQPAPTAGGVVATMTVSEPFATDAERFFSFWSVRTRAEDGRVVDAKQARVAELRGCFGPTSDRARQNFYAEVGLGGISF